MSNKLGIKLNNDTGVNIALQDGTGLALIVYGTVATSVLDEASAYQKGCVYVKTDAGSGVASNYVNTGTAATPSWNLTGEGTPGLQAYQETVTYDQFTDGGGAAGTFDLSLSLPIGAVVTQSLLDDITGFAGDTSAVITVGDGTDADRYNTGTPDVFTTIAAVSAGAVSGTAYHAAAKTPKLTVTSAADFGAVTAGSVTVTIFYYQGS